MFVDSGVKVNGQYYRDVLLSQQMIPAIKQVAGDILSSSKTLLRHITPVIPSSCCRERRLTSLVLTSGRPTVQTRIPSTTRSEASAAGVWITRQQRRWAEETSPRRLAWCASLTWLSASGDSDWERACVHTGDIWTFVVSLCNTNLRWKPIRANRLLLNFVY